MEFPEMIMGTFKLDNSTILNELVIKSIECGCNAFDTSPSYGTETKLGQALKNAYNTIGIEREDLFISDKIDGWQMCEDNGKIEKRVDFALKQMGLEYFDAILIHWPFEKYIQNTWDSLKKLKDCGKAHFIGICNLSYEKKIRLKNKGIDLHPDIVQNEISPLRACEHDISLWKQDNIYVQAYSPLCRMNKKIRESERLQNIAKHYNKSVPQIILKWHLQRGLAPVFSSSKPDRIQSNLDIKDFVLSESDIRDITLLDENYKVFPESFGCPGY